MIKMRWLLIFLFGISLPLFAAPPIKENLAIQEFRLDLAEHGQALHSHKVEIELLNEKLDNLQLSLSGFKDEMKGNGEVDIEVTKERASQLEKRVATLEKQSKSLSSDLSLLKDHINAATSSVADMERKWGSLEKDLSLDIKNLKSTLQSIVAYVEGGPSKLSTKNYIVQSGDTLEKIALKNKTTIRELKDLNALNSDKIFSGQKLQLP